MPEYSHFLRLDRYSNNLQSWINTRLRAYQAYDLLTKLFIYNPDKRITAKDALEHKWFQDDPKPNRKYAVLICQIRVSQLFIILPVPSTLCQRTRHLHNVE